MTPTPTVNPFAGIFLMVSATNAQGQTTFLVGFDDRRDPRPYTYAWSISLTGSDCAGAGATFSVAPTAQYLASWTHPDCVHSPFPTERVTVVVSLGTQSVTITGSSLGPAIARP